MNNIHDKQAQEHSWEYALAIDYNGDGSVPRMILPLERVKENFGIELPATVGEIIRKLKEAADKPRKGLWYKFSYWGFALMRRGVVVRNGKIHHSDYEYRSPLYVWDGKHEEDYYVWNKLCKVDKRQAASAGVEVLYDQQHSERMLRY